MILIPGFSALGAGVRQRYLGIPVVKHSAAMTRHSCTLALQAIQEHAALFAGVLEDTVEDADGGDETVVPLDWNEPIHRHRPDRQALQLYIIDKHLPIAAGEIGCKSPIQFAPSSKELIAKVDLPGPEVDVLLVPGAQRGKRATVTAKSGRLPSFEKLGKRAWDEEHMASSTVSFSSSGMLWRLRNARKCDMACS